MRDHVQYVTIAPDNDLAKALKAAADDWDDLEIDTGEAVYSVWLTHLSKRPKRFQQPDADYQKLLHTKVNQRPLSYYDKLPGTKVKPRPLTYYDRFLRTTAPAARPLPDDEHD